jgi:hypothetical protein
MAQRPVWLSRPRRYSARQSATLEDVQQPLFLSHSMNRHLQFLVLLTAGLIYGSFAFRTLMWAVWGAPTHPIQYIALFSTLGLSVSAFIAVASPKTGRWLSIVCTLGVGIYYIPAAQTLVPSTTSTNSPIAFLLIGGFFLLLAFCLFYPTQMVISIPVMALCLLIAAGFWANTLRERISDGEFRRPALAYFKWTPSNADLHIINSRDQEWLPEGILSFLSSQGTKGSLRWQGSQGRGDNSPKMIIISSGPIPQNKDLHYPKGDYVVYVFNGTDWTTIPHDAEFYPSFATLETDGMIYQRTSSGGRWGTSAFLW